MKVHLIDGTYELFRHYFAMPSQKDAQGREIAAVRGVVVSMMNLLREEATHLAVATDHVIRSFRNDLWEDYKTGDGIEPDLLAQFPLLERALEDLGVVVWPMVEHEADDGLATGAEIAAADPRVEEVQICTPDKDLAQCVGGKVVQYDRRKRQRIDVAAVREKFGVEPESIPDYLALVGDSADGFPGLKGWGAKSSSIVLARYRHIEQVPESADDWDVKVRSAAKLAAVLAEQKSLALLFRKIATVVRDAPVGSTVDDLRWRGPRSEFEDWARGVDAPDLARQARLISGGTAPSSADVPF